MGLISPVLLLWTAAAFLHAQPQPRPPPQHPPAISVAGASSQKPRGLSSLRVRFERIQPKKSPPNPPLMLPPELPPPSPPPTRKSPPPPKSPSAATFPPQTGRDTLDSLLNFLKVSGSPVSGVMELRSLLLSQKEEKILLGSLVDQMRVDLRGMR